MMDFQWVTGIEYHARIVDFLLSIDEIMIPKLSDRVNVTEYAMKLALRADTLFVSEFSVDVGACSVYCDTQNAYISSIALKKDYMQHGIGKKIMENVKTHAIDKSCSLIRLEVAEDNRNAVSYYRKNGFEMINMREGWLLMECKLK